MEFQLALNNFFATNVKENATDFLTAFEGVKTIIEARGVLQGLRARVTTPGYTGPLKERDFNPLDDFLSTFETIETTAASENKTVEINPAFMAAVIANAGPGNSIVSVQKPLTWDETKAHARAIFKKENKIVIPVGAASEFEGNVTMRLASNALALPIVEEYLGKYLTKSLVFFDEKPERNHVKTNNDFVLEIHEATFINEANGREYRVFSLSPLPLASIRINAVVVGLRDVHLVGETASLRHQKPILLCVSRPARVKPTIETLEKIAGNSSLLGATVFGKFRHPAFFEALINAMLFSAPYGDELGEYGLNLMVLDRGGLGKTTFQQGLNRALGYPDENVWDGTTSTLKSLVPNFGQQAVDEGYYAKCPEIAFIDELGKALTRGEARDIETRGDALGNLNNLLTGREVKAASGRGSVVIKGRANALATCNPLKGTNDLVGLLELEFSTISRFFPYFATESHKAFVNARKGIIGLEPTPAKLPPREFKRLLSWARSFHAQGVQEAMPGILKEVRAALREATPGDDAPAKVLQYYDARMTHHICCLLDGVCKTRCILEGKPESGFIVSKEDVARATEILGVIVLSWCADVNKKALPVKSRLEYCTEFQKAIFDVVSEGAKDWPHAVDVETIKTRALAAGVNEKQVAQVESALTALVGLEAIYDNVDFKGYTPYWFKKREGAGND